MYWELSPTTGLLVDQCRPQMRGTAVPLVRRSLRAPGREIPMENPEPKARLQRGSWIDTCQLLVVGVPHRSSSIQRMLDTAA